MAWGSGIGGRVPQPSATRLLGYLAAMQQRHAADSSETSAQAAVDYILGKLDAAEATWAKAGPGALLPLLLTFSMLRFRLLPHSCMQRFNATPAAA